MWTEQKLGEKRINVIRLEQLRATGAGRIATACPHCLTMLESARATAGRDAESIVLEDVAEIVAQALPEA